MQKHTSVQKHSDATHGQFASQLERCSQLSSLGRPHHRLTRSPNLHTPGAVHQRGHLCQVVAHHQQRRLALELREQLNHLWSVEQHKTKLGGYLKPGSQVPVGCEEVECVSVWCVLVSVGGSLSITSFKGPSQWPAHSVYPTKALGKLHHICPTCLRAGPMQQHQC